MRHRGTIFGSGVLVSSAGETCVDYRIDGYWDGNMKTALGVITGEEPRLWAAFRHRDQVLRVKGGEVKVIITQLSGDEGEIRCSGTVPGL